MPNILKKCFLFHYDPSINSDKVFNLFLIDNENGSFSSISEYGRSGTILNIKSLIENCSLHLAQSKYSAKLNEKIYHKRTPYTHTLNDANSPTLKQFGAAKVSPIKPSEPAKIFDFKAVNSNIRATTENKSGGQNLSEERAKQTKKIGVLNLNGLDALEI
ncbi:MAG: hypothetical protein ABJA66_19085 [Actinomycetota bacterium]